MTIRDTLHLSLTNVGRYKTRSLLTVLTISIFFCFIIIFNFVINGLETTLLRASVVNTDGQVYTLIPFYDESAPRSYQKQQNLLQRYHGAVLGTALEASVLSSAIILDQAAASPLISTPLTDVPADYLPALTASGSLQLNTDLYQIPDVFFSVGTTPSLSSQHKLELPNNLLNLPLSIVGNSAHTAFYPIATPQFNTYLATLGYDESDPYQQAATQHYRVARFDNYHDAIAFANSDMQFFGPLKISSQSANATDLFSNTLLIANSFQLTQAILLIIEIFFLLAAVIIASMTFSHLIDQDAHTIALYHSIGATSRDIHAIYSFYLLILCGISATLSTLIALSISGIISLINAPALSQLLQDYYLLSTPPSTQLFSFDGYFWITILLIILVAPLTMGLSARHFSARNIAKQLKAD